MALYGVIWNIHYFMINLYYCIRRNPMTPTFNDFLFTPLKSCLFCRIYRDVLQFPLWKERILSRSFLCTNPLQNMLQKCLWQRNTKYCSLLNHVLATWKCLYIFLRDIHRRHFILVNVHTIWSKNKKVDFGNRWG